MSVPVCGPEWKVLYLASMTEPQRGKKMTPHWPCGVQKRERHVLPFLAKPLKNDKTMESWIDCLAYLGTEDLKIDWLGFPHCVERKINSFCVLNRNMGVIEPVTGHDGVLLTRTRKNSAICVGQWLRPRWDGEAWCLQLTTRPGVCPLPPIPWHYVSSLELLLCNLERKWRVTELAEIKISPL